FRQLAIRSRYIDSIRRVGRAYKIYLDQPEPTGRGGTWTLGPTRGREAEQGSEAEHAAWSVGDPPQPAVRGGVRLVLPRVRARLRVVGVQVVHEQRGHQDLGGGRLEDLDAEPARARIGRREHPVLQYRPGPGRRGDVQRNHRAALPGD